MYREVDPELWMAGAPLGAALGLASIQSYQGPTWLPYAGNGLVVLLFAALYHYRLMGGADLASIAFLSISLPVAGGSILPSSMLVVVYSSPFIAIHYMGELLRRCGPSCLKTMRARVKGRVLVSEYKWWLPWGARLEGDPHEVVAMLDAWEEEVEAAPLLPLVTLLYMGLLVAVLVGDAPLLAALGGLR